MGSASPSSERSPRQPKTNSTLRVSPSPPATCAAATRTAKRTASRPSSPRCRPTISPPMQASPAPTRNRGFSTACRAVPIRPSTRKVRPSAPRLTTGRPTPRDRRRIVQREAGGAEMGGGAAGGEIEDGEVAAGGCVDGNEGRLDSISLQQALEAVAVGLSDQSVGFHGLAEGCDGPCGVDSLAAGERPVLAEVGNASEVERGGREQLVEAGVEGYGADHRASKQRFEAKFLFARSGNGPQTVSRALAQTVFPRCEGSRTTKTARAIVFIACETRKFVELPGFQGSRETNRAMRAAKMALRRPREGCREASEAYQASPSGAW